MSKEIIDAIRRAETDAARIRADASARAAEMTADAETRGEALLAETERQTKAEIDAKFALLREKTGRLIEKTRAEARSDAEETKKQASFRMRAAVDEIFRGLDKQCR